MGKITLNTGEECNLTINFARLHILKKERKEEYKEYWKAIQEFGKKDGDSIFAALQIAHTAYLCGLIEKATPYEAHPEVHEGADFVEFMGLMEDYTPIEVLNLAKDLISPKNKAASGKPSEEKPGTEAKME